MHKSIYTLGQNYVLRLPPGEDLLVGLYRICREYNIQFGTFQATGAVRSATIGHLNQETGGVRRQVLEKGQDLVNCIGNISPQGDSISIHIYAVFSAADGRLAGGALLSAEVYVVEVVIQELKGKPLVRERDPETGLLLWPVA